MSDTPTIIDLWEGTEKPFDPRYTFFGGELQKQVDKINDTDESKRDLTRLGTTDNTDDVAIITGPGGYIGLYDITGIGNTDSEQDLIYRYREAAMQPEADMAINDIVDEAVASLESGAPVKLVVDDLDYEESVKKKFLAEFDNILRLFNFSENGSELFKKWYIDGRLYFHAVIDRKKVNEGIQELNLLDAAKVNRVKEIKEEYDRRTNAKLSEVVNEFYTYSDESITGTVSLVQLPTASVIEVNSGLTDAKGKRRLSYLHKALKPINQLRLMEDSLVIYRISRAPERRVFYIDTGNLPKGKAEEYVRNVMSQYRNKVSYDITTGNVQSDRKHLNMLEDFFLPRREGSRGTEISTLPGGTSLGELDDVLFFTQQLYKALHVPRSRIDTDNNFPGVSGRALEITRDEIKFQKFINRLRKRFSYLLLDALKLQLQLKGIVTESDWNDIVQSLHIDFVKDNHFYELKEFEIFQSRLSIMRDLKEYVGTYFSQEFVYKKIFQMDEAEIEEMQTKIKEEKEAGIHGSEDGGGGSRW